MAGHHGEASYTFVEEGGNKRRVRRGQTKRVSDI